MHLNSGPDPPEYKTSDFDPEFPSTTAHILFTTPASIMSSTQPTSVISIMATPITATKIALDCLPPEIMTMIIQAPELRERQWYAPKVVMPILDTPDVFSLRPSSR